MRGMRQRDLRKRINFLNISLWTDGKKCYRSNNIHIAASALSSLASLSLSAASSVPAPVNTPSRHTRSRSQLEGQNISFSPSSFDANMFLSNMDMNRHHLGALASSVPNPSFTYAGSVGADDIEVDVEDDMDDNVSVADGVMDAGDKKSKKDNKDGKPGKGKKRGTIFKCESCSKVCIDALQFYLPPFSPRAVRACIANDALGSCFCVQSHIFSFFSTLSIFGA